MNTKFTLFSAALLSAASVFAAEPADVTATYLKNTQFNGPDYTWNAEASGTINEVAGTVSDWTVSELPGYYAFGTAQYGTSVDIKGNGLIPSAGYEDSEGGCLVFATAWGSQIYATQDVELPAGKYTLRAATYNCNKGSGTSGTSMLAWIPAEGDAVESSMTYQLREWQTDEITFTLTETTQGKIRLGVTKADGGSGSTAKPCIDYVQLMREDLGSAAILPDLKAAIAEGKTILASDPAVTPELIANLQAAITAAEAMTESNTVDEILAAQAALNTELQAIKAGMAVMAPITETYNLALAAGAEGEEGFAAYKAQLDEIRNAAIGRELSADEILDIRKQIIAAQRAFITRGYTDATNQLVNPSFEDGLDGWESVGLKLQSNNDPTIVAYKDGSNYAEKWVGNTEGVGSCSLLQDVALEAGEYILIAAAQNQRQGQTWTATNAWLVAGEAQTDVNFMNIYSVKFALAEAGNVTLGLKCVDATGNWVSFEAVGLYKKMTTSIEAIEAEAAEAVYYNLQGCKVNNPAQGIYIVKRGNKVSKEVIR